MMQVTNSGKRPKNDHEVNIEGKFVGEGDPGVDKVEKKCKVEKKIQKRNIR